MLMAQIAVEQALQFNHVNKMRLVRPIQPRKGSIAPLVQKPSNHAGQEELSQRVSGIHETSE